ncbi:unnamed protein product [Callosobruchus maculatus]|uniref:Uncharacterized protein n=1 Tax=Callosobruchus maculatus TaxID=64391 RepID=A0A653BGZ0_CALMS|nr:unnamed protein product [Callosobruchus maculatus]
MRGYHVIVCSLLAVSVIAQDSFDTSGVRIALKIYDDCAKADGFSPCLKKKAITFLDRLSRMEKLTIADGVVLARAADATKDGLPITEEQLENTLPRSSDAKDDALNGLLMDKVSNFIGSRTVEVALPKITAEDFVGTGQNRTISLSDLLGGGGGGQGGGGGGGGGKMKNMMGGMMMAVAAKMAALVPIAIAGLFLLAGKALITAKIALLISGIIAIKKLFASKNQGGGGHGGGWQSSGHGGGGGGGWQSSGGGWDKRSLEDASAQNLAYKAYAPK